MNLPCRYSGNETCQQVKDDIGGFFKALRNTRKQKQILHSYIKKVQTNFTRCAGSGEEDSMNSGPQNIKTGTPSRDVCLDTFG